MSQHGISTQLKPASRKAIAQAAEAKRREIEGDTSADPAADDNDVGDVWPKSEPEYEPRIKQEQSTPAQCPPSYWSAQTPNFTPLTQPTSHSHFQATSTNALRREQLHSTPYQDYWQSIARSYPPQHPLPVSVHDPTGYAPCIPIKRLTSPEAIIKQEVMNDQEDAEDDVMTEDQDLTDSSGVREHGLARYLISEPFPPPMRSDQLCSVSHNASPDPTMPMESDSQRSNHPADLNDQYSNLSTAARLQEVIVIAD